MKNNYFKHLFTVLLLLCATMASAHDFEVDSIYYNIKDDVNKTVEVTYRGASYRDYSDEYTGSVAIPGVVVYNGVSYSVTSIGDYTFALCSGLTSIEIPNSVTSIGYAAFWNCTGLTSIEIPNSVTSIEEYAFEGCENLASVHISDLVAWCNIEFGIYYASEIPGPGTGAAVKAPENRKSKSSNYTGWRGLSSNPLVYGKLYLNGELLKDIVIPDGVSKIKANAFCGYRALESVKIPNSVTSIGTIAFKGCTSLTSIEIPNSLKSIGKSAFDGCNGIKGVYIRDVVAWCSIDFSNEHANPLYSADNLYLNGEPVTQLVIPEGAKCIKKYAFYECSSLTSVEIGNNVENIGDCAFQNCTNLSSVVIGNGVTSIGRSAFNGCSGLTSVEIGNNVESIGESAFNGCSGLTGELVIPNSVTSIGGGAFNGCSGLTSVVIGNGVTSIGGGAFYGCSGLTSVTIPNSVTSIGGGAFEGCSGLTNIVIPNSVTSIGSNAFRDCEGLTSVVIGNGVTSIGSNAFEGCSGLTNIVIPNSVTSIGSNAFRDCEGLTSVVIGNGVTSIGEYAFEGCENLASVHISDLVAWCNIKFGIYYAYEIPSSGAGAAVKAPENRKSKSSNYNDWYGLSSNPLVYGKLYLNGELLKDIVIPDGVSKIKANAFCGYRALESVKIPNSVTSIGTIAFCGCTSLTSIEIPNSLKSIGESAFGGCNGLKEIYSLSAEPARITSTTFDNYSATLYVPSCAKDAYEKAAYWKNFTNIVDFVDKDLEFTITSEDAATVAVTGYTGNKSSVIIPSHCTIDEKTYTVTSIGESAFSGCTSLASIMIPCSVTSVGFNAFRYCWRLTSIEIPYSVTSIESNAFYGCSGLTSIEIPYSVASIGSNAFYYCSGLQSIVVAEGNTVYDSRNNCNAIIETATNTLVRGCQNTIIPNSVTSIGDYAFRGCPGLTNIEIPGSITSIGCWAFSGTAWYDNQPDGVVYAGNILYAYKGTIPSNTSIVVKDGTLSIAGAAFNGCSGLTSITIPNGVTSIGVQAFNGCSGLTSVEIGNNVENIGKLAFNDCSGLTSIEIPNSVTSIESYAFNGCSGLKEVHINDLSAWCNISFGDYEANPLSYAKNLYFNGKLVTELVIPDDVKEIKDYAFNNCSGLTSVEIPNSVTSIGEGAFNKCWKLKEIYSLSAEPARITSTTFYNYSATLYVPECTKKIYENETEWSRFTNIVEIEVVDKDLEFTITSEDAATVAVTGYTGNSSSVIIPSHCTINGKRYTVTSIGNNAFDGYKGLTSITIPNSVTSIGDYAFRSCEGLASLEIPNSVTSIGYNAFVLCTGLKSIEIPAGVTNIENSAFSSCSGLESIVVAEGNTVYDSRNNCNAIIETATNTLLQGCQNTTVPSSVTGIGHSAFYLCTALKSIEIANSVTTIADYAFGNCEGLTSIEIPNSVTSIGNSAFLNCTNLSSVVIGNGVTSIGEGAFFRCSGLKEVHINDLSAWCNISFGGSYANPLYYAKNLYLNGKLVTELVIPDDVKEIKDYAFERCSALTSVELPVSLRSIGENAFVLCTGLKSIEIPASVTNIENSAFSSCSGLESIVVAEGNAVYDSRNNCNAIIETATNTLLQGCQNTTVPSSVTSIGSNAFRDCSALTSIEIPNSVTSIGESAFYGCAELKNVVNFSELTVSKGSSNNGFIAYYADKVINAPNGFVDGDFAWGIDDDGMYVLCSYLGDATELTLPTDYKGENYKIGEAAFDGCTALTSVEIPNSVTSIGNSAFQNCTNLSSVVIGNGVTSIGNDAFYGCSGLTGELVIPNSVTSIGNGAFYGCSGLKEVHINDLFAWCNISFGDYDANPLCYAKNLYLNGKLVTNLVIPDDVKEIKDYAFERCSALTSVEIPNSVTSIGYEAFRNCSGLTSITIPNSVTSIGGSAFSGCSGLTSVTIGNSVTSIGNHAFFFCSGLKEVHINDLSAWCNISFGDYEANPLYYAKNLYLNGKLVTELVIPDDVKEIKDYAFERCRALTSVELPVSLRSIGEQAFDGCTSLVSVLICENVENIGAGAFNSCNKLKSITSLIPAEKLFAIPGLASSRIYRTCTLYVHIGAGETYAATEGWSRFVNIVEQDLSDIEDVLGEELDNAVFYDLNGRVVEYPTNGIYIVNGKKVLVK